VTYQVRLAPRAMSELDRLPAQVATVIINFIREQLGKRPEAVGVPLGGGLKGWLVVKHKQYRIIYSVDAAATKVDILRIL
jgi:mRNA-degrading endonuclease RelE of RelBE toxin-antitoxin system